MEKPSGTPVFCVEVSDKEAERKLFLNFNASGSVEAPSKELDERQMIQEMFKPTSILDDFKIPFSSSPIFWTKENVDGKRQYVIEVLLNDKFTTRKVVNSVAIRHFVILVVMSEIVDKYDDMSSKQSHGQFLGHKLDLDPNSYKVLDGKQRVERLNELVNNKVTFAPSSGSSNRTSKPGEGSANDKPYDLFYRPNSKLLTCSISTDKLPDSLAFNEDRIIVKLNEKPLMDIYIPFYIDLKEPVKYKFDDKLCLFRAVFKITELHP